MCAYTVASPQVGPLLHVSAHLPLKGRDFLNFRGGRMKTISIVVVLSLAAVVSTVAAQGFKPNKPIEFVTHTGPGDGGDVFARGIAAAMEKEGLMPVRMQVVNKTGGGGLTAMAYLAEKQGETHTIAVFTGIWFTNPIMRKEAKFSMSDLTPVVRLVLE